MKAGLKALFDTNILVDYLSGIAAAKAEVDLYDDKAISIITWMEVQIGTDEADQVSVDRFLSKFTLVPLDAEVSARAVALRRKSRIKLPDAIIWATALVEGRLLVTRNVKDFPARNPGVRIAYSLVP
jgi:predicted nucleic acid-binding protein